MPAALALHRPITRTPHPVIETILMMIMLLVVVRGPHGTAGEAETPSWSSTAEEEFVLPPDQAGWKDVRRDFGAVGDGKADDTKALQTAIDYLFSDGRRLVFIPPGTYRITATLEAPRATLANPFVPEGALVTGADPLTTTIVWDGPRGRPMVWLDAVAYSTWQRLTLDGQGNAGAGMWCQWTVHQPSTQVLLRDLRLRRLAFGIRAPRNDHKMFSETMIRRCWFEDISEVGVQTASANHQSWFIMHSRFDRCRVGARCDGYREIAVYDSVFTGSSDADLRGVQAARGCVSYRSRTFYQGEDHPIENEVVLQGNRIIDPLDGPAINLATGGSWLNHLLDNRIRSAHPPIALSGGAQVLMVGNVGSSAIAGGGNGVVLDNGSGRIDAAEPPPFHFAPLRQRPLAVVSGRSEREVQAAVDQAVALEKAKPGSRPVIWLHGDYTFATPVVIPPRTDVQILGPRARITAAAGGTATASGSPRNGALFRIVGPTRVTIADVTLDGSTGRSQGNDGPFDQALLFEQCDQPESRLISDFCAVNASNTRADGSRRLGLVVDRAEYLRVEALMWNGGMVQVIGGGGDPAAGTYLYGAVNVTSNPALELIDGGRAVFQEAYSEIFDNLGPGPQRQVIVCRGTGARPGAVTMDIYSNNTDKKDAVFYRFDDWHGSATFLSGTGWTGKARITESAPGLGRTSLLSVGFFPALDTPLPATAKVLQVRRDGAPLRAQVSDDGAFLRAGLAQRRQATLTPQPLTPVPLGASDIQLRHVTLWPGRRTAILVQGSGQYLDASPFDRLKPRLLKKEIAKARTATTLKPALTMLQGLATNAPTPEERTEAADLAGQIERWGVARVEFLRERESADPPAAEQGYQELAKLYADLPPGEQALARLADAGFRAERSAFPVAQKLLAIEQRFRQVKSAQRADASDPAWAKANATAIAELKRGLQALSRDYPGTLATARVSEFLQRYGVSIE